MFEIRRLARPPLAEASLTVAAGECVAILGPSGAGKSLLLRAVADLDPNRGEVLLDGRARSSVSGPAWRRLVAYLAAESGWWLERVGAHMADPATAAGVARELGLPPECLGWPVARLSTGERQRLALVRALVRRPRVLLLDEPTSALDEVARSAVEGTLRRHLAEGGAAILVTHDPALAARLAARRFLMRAGRLEEAAP
jgi:UDP-glucose/iron transport system ATP-binding protein